MTSWPVTARLRSPVAKYYAYKTTEFVSFTTAIWILFVRSRGLSFAEVGALNSVWWLALVAAEIPTGYLGDRLGRRSAMALGTAVIAVSTAAMGLSETFLQLAVVYGAWAVGQTFRSGSDDAWLYDLLAETDETHEFAAVRGRATGVGLAIGAVTTLAGGLLADATNYAVPFFATAAVTALGVPILLSVPETGATGGDFTPRTALRVIREKLSRPPLRGFVAYFALLFGVANMVYIFDQPILRDVALDLGVPATATNTAVSASYALFSLVAAAATFRAGWVESRVGVRRWFLASPLVLAVAYASVPLFGPLAFPAFAVARGVTNVSSVLGNQYVNDRVDSVGRATVLSAAGMLYSLAVVPFELAGGVVADALSPAGALALFGGVLVVGAGLLWTVERPV
ncbi:MFS transporter [Haloferax volcanii]|uniref:Multidrug efflux protein variant n=3 Tax=Haloferax volcanii TaxID=2246 RepID=A0A384LDQ0_HALVD|nr:MFS transporter [Haloferax volcanii]ADE04287.1 major facilitator superfamily transport protein [Haloferax volcanii DS2]ELY32487.1 multidrug efflux protein variant [Haloferax volcanii DS2]MBS8118340.1 MFS transporter [Haloferax volcanii]MBS8123353.1 MFS transporter [Haloferax volcanii]MBS8127221.1 MFS transporter [Haloferax volcanii]